MAVQEFESTDEPTRLELVEPARLDDDVLSYHEHQALDSLVRKIARAGESVVNLLRHPVATSREWLDRQSLVFGTVDDIDDYYSRHPEKMKELIRQQQEE